MFLLLWIEILKSVFACDLSAKKRRPSQSYSSLFASSLVFTRSRRRGLRFSPARRFPSPPTVSGLRHLHLAVPALSLHRRLAVASSSRGSHSRFLVLTLQSRGLCRVYINSQRTNL